MGFVSQLWHELTLLSFKRQDAVLPVGFYVLTILMFPLGLSPNPAFIREAAPGIVMVSLLFAHLLSLERMLSSDARSGLLDVYRSHARGATSFLLAKVLANWLSLTLPIVLLSPITAALLGLESDVVMAMVFAVVVGTPYLSLMGGVGAALTLGVRNGALMLILILLPLFVAPLIFMAGAMQNAGLDGVPYRAELALLGAMSLAALMICPLLMSRILRMLD